MQINPYLFFKGNAIEAIELYEKAFKSKAIIAKYKDAVLYDKSFVCPDGLKDGVMHASLRCGGSVIMFCDTVDDVGSAALTELMVSLDAPQEVDRIFNVLAAGGTVIEKPQTTFWSERFSAVKDKFGVYWLLSYENEAQRAQTYESREE